MRQRLLTRGRRVAALRGEPLATVSEFMVDHPDGHRAMASAWFWVEEDHAGTPASNRMGFLLLDHLRGEIEPLADGGWRLADSHALVRPASQPHTLPSLCIDSQHRMLGPGPGEAGCHFAHVCPQRALCLGVLAAARHGTDTEDAADV